MNKRFSREAAARLQAMSQMRRLAPGVQLTHAYGMQQTYAYAEVGLQLPHGLAKACRMVKT
jgi:hypothetical protein